MGTGFTVFAYSALAVWVFASLYAVGLWAWLSLPGHWRLLLIRPSPAKSSDADSRDIPSEDRDTLSADHTMHADDTRRGKLGKSRYAKPLLSSSAGLPAEVRTTSREDL